MDFTLTDEQIALRDEVKRFAEREIAPTAIERDEKEEFNHENWQKMADMGLLGLPFPAEYGGGGVDALTTCVAKEGFAMGGVDAGTTLSWGAHTILCGVPIWKMGTEEHRQKYLPKLCNGEWIGGFCLSEPGSGSDAAGMRTRAVKQGNKYILNGSKMWITNGPQGDLFVVTAVTDPTKKSFGISTFLVEKSFPGVSTSKPFNKMGNRTSPTCELYLENAEVPEENLLGPENFGFVQVAKLILGWERSCLLAPGVGAFDYLLRTCAKYAMEREQFKRPIGTFSAMQDKLADMRIGVEVARQLIYRVAWLLDNDKPVLTEAAIAKIFISEWFLRCADHGIQMHGGYGYIKEFPVERSWRDAKLGTIGGGTSEVQRSIIARSIMNLG